MSGSGTVVVVESDLFLRPRIESSLRAGGFAPRFVVSAEAFDAALAKRPAAILVNLASRGIPFEPLVAAARARWGEELAVVGYGPHVDAGLLARAREAGCTEAVPNGLVARNAAGVVSLHVADRT
ncbi:MAG: hypothetical protein OEQ13_03515 [Acidobacteriota bacterium]|nr:hypothetical protein [Acidobacteriota bacterium]